MYDYYLTDEHYATAERNGISKDRVYARVYRSGWKIEKAITKPVKVYCQEWKKWTPLAEQNGINLHTFRSRVNSGIDPYEAATVKSFKRKDSIPEEVYRAAEQIGVSRENTSNRIRNLKWSHEKAMTTPYMGIGGHRKVGN
jgi:hypothetical protein